MDSSKLRAWWWQKQGLDGSLVGESAATVLERCGWARSVGGAGPYLGLFARAGISREAVDQCLVDQEIHELPSARGCTYVVPASDFALALRLSQDFTAAPLKVAANLGVTDAEIEKLCVAVVKSLKSGPLNPEQIREATGSASRSLGEAGKKKGVTTTLPLAFGVLQSRGDIRRVPANGRLDQQRYLYALWKPNPLKSVRMTSEDAHRQLAERYFRWIGPARLSEFQTFAAVSAKAVKTAVEPLGLVPAEDGSTFLLLPEDAIAFNRFKPPAKPQYALVSSLDAIHAHRRDITGLTDAADLERDVIDEKTSTRLGGLSDLPSHAILDRGRLIGLWEYDPVSESIAWSPFGVRDKHLTAAVKRTEIFIRDQLGDARSFSLDSPASRGTRIEALRTAG